MNDHIGHLDIHFLRMGQISTLEIHNILLEMLLHSQ